MAEAESLTSIRRGGPRRVPNRAGLLPALGAMCLAAGCLTPRGDAPEPSAAPLRISELLDRGDPTSRASLQLVERGLAADAGGQPELALDRYERAIRVDPTNPYAYLALARYYVERGDVDRGLEVLDQAEVLLGAREEMAPRVEAHLLGLRGAALSRAGRSTDGEALLARAARLAPSVWDDGSLSADELR